MAKCLPLDAHISRPSIEPSSGSARNPKSPLRPYLPAFARPCVLLEPLHARKQAAALASRSVPVSCDAGSRPVGHAKGRADPPHGPPSPCRPLGGGGGGSPALRSPKREDLAAAAASGELEAPTRHHAMSAGPSKGLQVCAYCTTSGVRQRRGRRAGRRESGPSTWPRATLQLPVGDPLPLSGPCGRCRSEDRWFRGGS